MKKIFTLSGLLLSAAIIYAQPVLQNSNLLPVGFVDSISTASATIAPGNGGANITWDFSTLAATVVGFVEVVDPATSPYIGTFPTANFCTKIIPTGSSTAIYGYDRVSATAWEELATNYSGPGTGKDYTPNPESNLELPFHYNDAFTDAFQSTTSSASSVDISYDGYGTLITPFATYTNVARVKKYWGVGDYSYSWYTTNPFITVMGYDATGNKYTFIGNGPATAVGNVSVVCNTVQVYPNPLANTSTIKVSAGNLNNATFILADVTGRRLKQIALTQTETTLQKDGLAAGVYFYQVVNNGAAIANGKLVVE